MAVRQQDETDVLQVTDDVAAFCAQNAAAVDREGAFPVEEFALIARSGLLAAPLYRTLGGFGLGVDTQQNSTLTLLRVLKGPQTILVPWRRDPQPDHRASWSLIAAALARDPAYEVRRIEYLIWLWELAAAGDAPRPDEATTWRLDIGSVLPRKRAAIAAHRSQTTDLIDDDPTGFRLTPDILAHFAHPWEVYLEAISC